ncbi:MAG: ice-binding family protein [Pseudomonas sp.]|uniref:ice-binding family protein n=1 Tax=Pseudomonas sp. TaxID=306 RepID=UPI0027366CC0|nr:ice-binding family protein [Pseudomonas sp.]MDP3845808.1 ice-binding family protein [Pseudomonas sp.]
MKRSTCLLGALIGFTLLHGTSPVLAATAPPLGAAAHFSVLGSATVTNTGPSIVNGNLGVSPGSAATGFQPDNLINGSPHTADALAARARHAAIRAYHDLTAQACTTTFSVPTDVGGMTLLPGVYCFASSAAVTGTLTLDAQADPDAVFVFKTVSTLTTATDASVAVINSGQGCNVFWQVGSSATLGTTSRVPGTLIARASITLNTAARLSGRAIALHGAVTLDNNQVGGCATGQGAVTAPPLGAATRFAVLGSTTVTNTGPSIVSGHLGVSPGSAVTGFLPGKLVKGAIHAADVRAAQAKHAAIRAYQDLATQACTTTFGVPTDVGGMTLLPGVYCFASSAAVTGTLTLDAQADPNAVFVFKAASTLITATGSSVAVINNGQGCNVFWQVGSSATLGTTSRVPGTLIALTSISLNTAAHLSGRAIALNGAVTLDNNQVGGCSAGQGGGARVEMPAD